MLNGEFDGMLLGNLMGCYRLGSLDLMGCYRLGSLMGFSWGDLAGIQWKLPGET